MVELGRLLNAQLDESFVLYDELIGGLSGEDLGRKLPVPSNTLGAQLWCVIGARESWARAIAQGAWSGFACSITSREDLVRPDVMRAALARSAVAVRQAIRTAADDEARTQLKLKLLVHESQHQGQILRYLLGLNMTIAPGWKERFAL